MKNKKKKYSKSVKKYIRKEKSRLRREVLDKQEYYKKIQELYGRFTKNN